jgi:hypothetical protein
MKFIKILFVLLMIVIITDVIFQFIINTKYSFPMPVRFHGDKLYNPYAGFDSTKWKRANFHLHTKLYSGLTAGAFNSEQVADSFYNFFGYDIYCKSDYMRINTADSSNKVFIPVYEHGYQFYKTHQLVINAKKVSWIDYFFRQTLDNKQYIINRLKQDSSALVVIVHPWYRKAYKFSDFNRLGNYDCLEVVNSKFPFIDYYDTVLSAGHAVFLMADDDAHNLSQLSDGAHSFNMINSDLEKNSIIHALRTGRSFGVNLNLKSVNSNNEKKAAINRLPVLTEMKLTHDTLMVRLNKKVNMIKFIGQSGVTKSSSTYSDYGSYIIGKNDTYIRTEIVCNDGSIFFLNPVLRYDGPGLPAVKPVINVTKTWTYRTVFVIILLTGIFIRTRSKLRGRGKKKEEGNGNS